jgi:hypothetical protein
MALVAFGLASCEPPRAASSPATEPALSSPVADSARADACQREIPDCAAACALRETGRTDHLEWFDRRCAAVVLGKNPDKAVGYVAPAVTFEPQAAAPARRPAWPPAAESDPFESRAGLGEPSECRSARAMRAAGRSREADALAAQCSAKGGSEAPPPPNVELPGKRRPDLGF